MLRSWLAPRPDCPGLPSHETPAGAGAHPPASAEFATTGAAGHPEITIVGVNWQLAYEVSTIFQLEDAVVVMSICAEAPAASAATARA